MRVAAGSIALVAIVVASASLIGPAQTQGFTAGVMYDICRDTISVDRNDNRLICASYIRGIVDTIRVQAFNATGSAEAHVQVMPFCFPAGTDAGATVDAFVRHVEAGRAARTDSAAMAVVEALRTKWPCSR